MARYNVSACILAILITWTPCVLSSGFNWNAREHLQPTELLVEFCKYHGYPLEVYYIHSYDGYILQIHRLPGRTRSDSKPAEAVLIMHGLISSSADFIVTGPKRSLAYILHDEGYDVWLGNSRGNTFSRNHTTLVPSQSAFWNFSWHEIGLNDAAATIDYVRNFTSQEKIFYIGYSQGTTQFWVLTSMKPEYNDRIKLMLALAPAAYLGHVRGLAKILSPAILNVKDQFEKDGYFELFAKLDLTKITKIACGISSTSGPLCNILLTLVVGSSEDTDYKNFADLLYFSPAGCSCKQVIHYAQQVEGPGHFRLYNYSKETNMRLYNSPVPPEYPVHKITVPVVLYNSGDDWLATPEDVELLKKKLPNVVEKYTLKSKRINHLDFIFGNTIPLLLYDRLLQRMREFSDA